MAERWTSVFFSPVLFTGSSFGKTDGCIHSRAFYCIFPKPINSLYHHLCVGKLWLALLGQRRRLLFWLKRGLVFSALAAGHDLKNSCHLSRCLSPRCFTCVELIVSPLRGTNRTHTSKSGLWIETTRLYFLECIKLFSNASWIKLIYSLIRCDV